MNFIVFIANLYQNNFNFSPTQIPVPSFIYMPHLICSFFYSFFSPSSSPLWSPLSFFPVPCPFIIAPSLPLVSRLAGSRWWGREGGRDVGEDGWREGWKTGGGDVLSSVPMFIPSQHRPTSWNCSWMFLLLCHCYYLQLRVPENNSLQIKRSDVVTFLDFVS